MRLLAILFPAALLAQSNLDFGQGTAGATPPGWFVPSVIQSVGYSAQLRREGCQAAAGCAVLIPPAHPPESTFGNLMQSFDAAPFRGKTVRLRASVKVETAAPAGRAQMWLRVDLPGGQMGFFDNMGDRPIAPGEWKSCEIAGEVAREAVSVNIGVISFGQGRVWIEAVSFETVDDAAPQADMAALTKLYARVDAAYAEGDVDAIAAFALPDARIRLGNTTIALQDALTQIMQEIRNGTKYVSRSAITSVRMAGSDAVVSVNNESTRTTAAGGQTVATTSRDTWTKTETGWKLKESNLITTRAAALATDPATAKAVAVELKQRAVPLRGVQAGAPLGDLAAFGKAVGDARIVALGEASHGTREFFQLKHRLLEFLVKEKGFTVFAIEANWPEALAVDRYIKTGEGDPKAALAGMYFWTWNTAEVLDMIEWMRAYNKAPGKHATLTFTSFDMQTARVAARKALDYLKQYAPDAEGPAAEAYTAAQDLEARRGQIYDGSAKSAADRAAAVLKVFDSSREQWIAASTPDAWRDARQAAAIVYQACTMRVPGKGPAWRDESMAGNVEWLAAQVHPGEKMVLWAHNAHVRFGSGPEGSRSMGTWLRQRYGDKMYVVGFAFRRGQLRAIGTRQGSFTGLAVYDVPPSPEGSGDAILSAASLPLFFLDMTRLPPEGALARWLVEPHLFHQVGATWVADDPESNLEPQPLSKIYDGLIFVEGSHAARPVNP